MEENLYAVTLTNDAAVIIVNLLDTGDEMIMHSFILIVSLHDFYKNYPQHILSIKKAGISCTD